MYKIRFHLKRDDNYLKWEIIDLNNNFTNYYSPNTYNLILKNCILKNDRRLAKQVLQTGKKVICAWIVFENYELLDKSNVDISNMKNIRYNPRFLPFWFNEYQENIDNNSYEEIFIIDKKLYVI